MKIQEIQLEVQKGIPILVGTFLSCEPSNRAFRDKETGKSRSFGSIKTWLLANNKPVQVVEYKDDDFRPESYQCPFKLNQPVAVRLEGMKDEKGVTQCKGVIVPIENN